LASKNKLEDFIRSFESLHIDKIESVEIPDENYGSIIVKYDSFLQVAKILKEDYGYVIPIGGGGVDYPKENRIQMIYYLRNPESRFTITLRVDLGRDDPRLPTLTQVWESMSFHEREAHEMFGIGFEGHNNLVPLLLPPDWKGGYPLRKDFKEEGAV
jgi:NADH:ubiquinone oxidoreductase subunit C